MKKVILIIIATFVLSSNANSQSGWQLVNLNTNKILSKIYMFDNIGYILTDSILYKTLDKGDSWSIIFTGLPNLDIYTGFFKSPDLGALLKTYPYSPVPGKLTTNGGKTFDEMNPQLPGIGGIISVFSIYPINHNVIIAAGEEFDFFPVWHDGVIFKSTNGGQTWTLVYRLPSNPSGIIGLKFKDENSGYAITSTGLHMTSNGGGHWAPKAGFAYSFDGKVVCLSDSFNDTIYAAGNTLSADSYYFRYIRSIDDGNTWSLIYQSEYTARIRGAFFLNSQTAWVVGDAGLILHTTNGGADWNKQISGTTETLYGVSFINSDTGFAVGNNGTLLKTYTGGLVGINQISQNVPTEIGLSQNFPNPFNPSTVIKFSLPESTHVNLTVYDQLGRIVESLVDSDLTTGTYQFIFNAKNLSSGLYYYRLSTVNYNQTKKMVILR